MRLALSIAAMFWGFACAFFIALASGAQWATIDGFICSCIGLAFGHVAFALVWTSSHWRGNGR